MANEIIVVVGTLSGAVIGGLINFVSNRSAKHHEWQLALARDQIASRQKLYAEFLVESQQLILKALEEKITSLSELNPLNGKLAEVSLVATKPVMEAATALANHAITSHSQQNAKEARDTFALKENFINCAKEELASISQKPNPSFKRDA